MKVTELELNVAEEFSNTCRASAAAAYKKLTDADREALKSPTLYVYISEKSSANIAMGIEMATRHGVSEAVNRLNIAINS